MEQVSVIIPVYNSEKYIEKCLRSVLDQSYEALDVLAIDDGSGDGSGEILDRMAAEDPRLRVFHQENRGVSAARNRGLAMASGTYVTFVDGDDYLGRDYISRLAECARKSGADMVIGGMTLESEDGTLLREILPGRYVRFEREEWTFRVSAAAAHLYRLELWREYDIVFPEGVRGEDMPISLFFSAICDNIDTVSCAEYHYVQHSTSAMHNFRGLRNYRLPYDALEETIRKVQKIGPRNSEEFFELFVMRILATCFFDLGRGASREKRGELSRYVVHILETYFPGYDKNRFAGLFSGLDVPFVQKAAVCLLVFLVKTGLICPVSVLLGGRQRRTLE